MEQHNGKKVGIVTINGYGNYGNRLQNYALQEIILNLGFNVDTVVVQENSMPNNSITNRVKKLYKIPIKEVYKKVIKKIKSFRVEKTNYKRTEIFKEFSDEYLSEKFYYNSQINEKIISAEYDFFITGSDQVWNPGHPKEMLAIYFLSFVDNHKRIAYAPSFGSPDIPNDYEELFKKWLSEMAYLSVREVAGAKIIKQLTGRDAPVLIDPTLMLTKEQWLSISKEVKHKPNNKYILTYFLGELSKETKNQINTISKQKNLKIINLSDLSDLVTYKTGPSEFIDYINSASIFFTDSFHGVVFSILMGTPFVVSKRIGPDIYSRMYSRIETLLDMFDLRLREECYINSSEQIFNTDFSHIPPILEAERRKALDYLRNAFDIKEAK